MNWKQSKGELMLRECLFDVFFREEIDSYSNDYISMMEYGEKVTADPSTFDDPQYMFLRERLKALQDGWEEVHQMWENRLQLLSQSLNLQMFERDARQAEVRVGSFFEKKKRYLGILFYRKNVTQSTPPDQEF